MSALAGSARYNSGSAEGVPGVIDTDHPFRWKKVPLDHILSTPDLSEMKRSPILAAARLLQIS